MLNCTITIDSVHVTKIATHNYICNHCCPINEENAKESWHRGKPKKTACG